jgi:hypothetical protein
MRCRAVWCLVMVLLAGCATSQPKRLEPRSGTGVAASFARTWNALQVVIVEQGIPVRSADARNGIVVGEDQPVAEENDGIADCGVALRTRVHPVRARWEMLVRGDSTNAVIRAAVRFVDPTSDECSSLGTWEKALEQRVKRLAELRADR